MASASINNKGNGGSLNLNNLLNVRRQLLVNPNSNRGSLDQNWQQIEKVSHDSSEQMANLPHWERSALEDDIKHHSPNKIDTIIGKPARNKAAGDAVNTSKILNGGKDKEPIKRWNEAVPEYPDDDSGQPQQDQSDGRNQAQDTQPEEEPADDGTGSDDKQGEPPEEPSTEGVKPTPELGGSSPATEGANTAAGADAAGTAAKVAGGLGEAAEGAGAVAEGAEALAGAGAGVAGTGAAAGAGAVAAGATGAGTAAAGAAVVESNPVGWILTIIAVLGVVILLVVGLTALYLKYPDKAGATTNGKPTVICIDPGHPSEVGSGTSSPSGVTENEMNWLVATELQKILESKGYQVVKTKDTASQYVTNKDRVDKCAAAGAVFDYRIHMDSPGSGGTPGPWHEVPGPSYTNIHATSKSYADAIQASLVKELGITNHTSGAQPLNGGVTNDTKALAGSKEANIKKIPAALIEMMTMDNVNVTWLKNSTNRTKLENGIANGIVSVIPPTSGTSGDTATEIVRIAKQELALNVSGRPNKYTDGNSEAWCADFVSWVLKAAGHPFTGGSSGGWRIPGVLSVKAWFEKNNEFLPNNGKNVPIPGDIVIHASGGNHHVNIVISVSGNTITIIGGNQSNSVSSYTENWHDSYIVGFGRVK